MENAEPTRAMNAANPPAPANSAPAAGAGQTPPPPTAASLQALAGELTASISAARVKAVEEVDLGVPEFRESTQPEIRQAEQLLRDAFMACRRENYRLAEAKCREAIALVPKDAAALELLGDLLQGVARITEALAAYKRATLADPKRSSAERKYADLLMRQENWDSVDLEAVPRNPWIGSILSLCLPGAGHLYMREGAKSVFFLLGDVVFAYLLGWSPWGFAGERPKGGVNTSLVALMVLTGIFYVGAVLDIATRGKGGRGRRGGGRSGWEV